MHRSEDGNAQLEDREPSHCGCDLVAPHPPEISPTCDSPARGGKRTHLPRQWDWRGWITLAWVVWWGWLYSLMVLETKFPWVLARLRALAEL